MIWDKLITVGQQQATLYDPTNHTFTNAGVSGRFGPSLAQCRVAYSSAPWRNNLSLFNVIAGVQLWTVPKSGSFLIDVAGAKGGGNNGGLGAKVQGIFQLPVGRKLKIIVGQMGGLTSQHPNYCGGGGGGTYVYFDEYDPFPLIVGGGGGGQSQSAVGGHGSATQMPNSSVGPSGNGPGGSDGNGGKGGYEVGAYSTGSGGAGWISNGLSGTLRRNPVGGVGLAPRNSSIGGLHKHPDYINADGGFGGGAGGTDNSGAGGGGGGWNGGGGGNNFITAQWGAGGGAGSYNSGSNQVNSSGVNGSHGYVKITFLS